MHMSCARWFVSFCRYLVPTRSPRVGRSWPAALDRKQLFTSCVSSLVLPLSCPGKVTPCGTKMASSTGQKTIAIASHVLLILCVAPGCTLGVHLVDTWWTLGVHLVYTGCTLDVHWVYTWCKLGVHWVYTWCTLGVHWVYIWCTLGLHWVYTWCTLAAVKW